MSSNQRKMDQLLDRIVDADSPLVAKSLEKRIDGLQTRQHTIEEKISQCGRPIRPYDEMYRTPELSLPFNLLGDDFG